MIDFEHSYAELPEDFYHEVEPTSAREPELLVFNDELAERLGLELDASDPELVELLSGRELPAGARPIAMAYAGHQFGNFVPRLGDGRAILLGEVVAPSGERYDLHLKGAGRTRYSRRGDGRASLGPVLREYLVSEAMAALGIPTTRALAAMRTGEEVMRQQRLPGASILRVASSHIRVGTFEFFAARRDTEHLEALADYAIARHDFDLRDLPRDERILSFFERVAHRQLDLVARWMGVGFIHGVMNTDNCSIAGETIDFGPCAFMDTYESGKVFSSIDRFGRYRYDNQGPIALWNLASFGNALLPLLEGDDLDASIAAFQGRIAEFREHFGRRWLEVMGAKLGLFEVREGDRELVEMWLEHLEDEELDFTNAFRRLSDDFEGDTDFHARWRERLDEQPHSREEVAARMDRHNPWIIPRNHQVERALDEARSGDLSHFRRLHRALSEPYRDRPEFEDLTEPPTPDEVVHQTFCGT
jgi:uncharacterized protein YdiU (UPF0061 family)